MRKIVLFLALLTALSLTERSWADPLPALEELEKMAGSGPEAIAAAAAMERDSQLIELERSREGARLFAALSIGYSDEPEYIGSSNNVSYTKFEAAAGAMFPLAGASRKLRMNSIRAEIAAADSKSKAKLLALHNLAAVRKAYAVIWTESEKLRLSRLFLSSEGEVRGVLLKRQNEGLLLPSDNLEFATAFSMARRDAAVSELKKTQAMQIIRLATGRMWEMPSKLSAPSLPAAPAGEPDISAAPAVAAQREILAGYERLAAVVRRTDIESAIMVGVKGSREEPGDWGSGAYMAYTVSRPSKQVFSGRDYDALAAKSDLERARSQAEYERIKGEGEAQEAAAYARYALANIEAQNDRLAAISRGVQEKQLRRNAIAGDTFERLQADRWQYYRTACDLLDSWQLYVQSASDLLVWLCPSGRDSEPASRAQAVSAAEAERLGTPLWFGGAAASAAGVTGPVKRNPKRGVYVWRAAPLLSETERGTQLRVMRSLGIDRILLSFTADEIKEITASPGAIRSLLATLSREGIKCELLLGDPEWLRPEKREGLFDIVRKLSVFPFDGIHLDIEPDSLPNAEGRRAELLSLLSETVRGVGALTPLAVAISIHPRYLEGDLGNRFAKLFSPADLSYIAPMIYSSDYKKVAERGSAILRRFPQYRFRFAQSVERSLPRAESYFDAGLPGFMAALEETAGAVADGGNFLGFLIQDYKDLKVMKR